MKDTHKYIIVKGAKENNLKNIDVTIPKNKLVVLTGVSGSGKSSLAFNTIYEEGRRRYVDSLSSYARQFLGGTQKPLVDSIDGLSPAISIEQKTTHSNPRSTVGTVTEIYDYLRLLFARVGKAYCPTHKIEIKSQTTNDIIKSIYKNPEDTKVIILAPVVKSEKGTHVGLFERLGKEGFLRVRVNGKIKNLDDEIKLDKNKRHTIDIVVDRIVLKKSIKSRIAEAVDLAAEYGKGIVAVEIVDGPTTIYSKFHACEHGDFNMPVIEPRLFSFNSPSGMCETCKGLGVRLKVDPKKLMPNMEKTIRQGGIHVYRNLDAENIDYQMLMINLEKHGISPDVPLKNMEKSKIDIIFYGSDIEHDYTIISKNGNEYKKHGLIEGVAGKMERRYINSTSEMVRTYYKNNYMSDISCETCKGQRVNEYARAVKIDKMNIYEFTTMPIDESLNKIISLKLSKEQVEIATLIINELTDRLAFLDNVGLSYLSLDRKAETLSGGEAQRIRLATQIGSNLTGVLYVLDEPSIGLHQSDNAKLIVALRKMVDIGNTLLVVEHDEETIRAADHIIDIGPKAGVHGGELVAEGTVAQIAANKKSITGDFLAGRDTIEVPKTRRSGNGKVLEILGAKANNLQNIDVKIPLGKFVSVTGVSGSGKSTLVNEVLSKGITKRITNPFVVPGAHRAIKGISNIDKIIKISQSPIGRTPKSNPATYTSTFDDIRDAFTLTQTSRARGYKKGRFSFNVDGGRCEKCRGDGSIKIEMHFLPDVHVKCDLCEGKRYNAETLEVKYKNKTIWDVLNMTIDEAALFFENNNKISVKLKTIQDVGLGYIKLGQPATTLSGGEAQRVKLATYLQKKPTGKTIYVLDEPTTGLHQKDVQKLISVLNRLVDHGDTVLVIEHNLDMIKVSDYIIDLGPGGGVNGGKVVAKGTPEQVITQENSLTGKYLKDMI